MAQTIAGVYDDTNNIPWDSQLVTIGGTAFIAEDFTATEGSNTVVSNNVSGVPRAARHMKTLITGSATLQFPTGSDLTKLPTILQTFTAQYRGTAKTWVLTEVGEPQKSGQETKVPIKFAEALVTAGGSGS